MDLTLGGLALPLAGFLVLFAGMWSFDAAVSIAIAEILVGQSAWSAGAVAGLAVVIVLRAVRFSPLSATGRTLFAWALVLFAWATLSWVVNGTPQTSVSAWLVPMAERLIIVYVVMRLPRKSDGSWIVVRGLLAGGIVQGLIGLAQATGHLTASRVAWVAAGVSESRVTGTTTDPNYYALSLAMIIAFALALRGSRRSALVPVSLAVVASAIVLSLSRTGFLALGAGFCAWLILELRPSAVREGRARLAGPLLLVLSAVVIAGPSQLLSRFAQLGGSVQFSSSAQQRVILWHAARQVASQHWLLGVGPDQVRYAMVAVAGPALPTTTIGTLPLSAHDTPLDVISDLGLPGFLLWVGLILIAIRAGLRQVKFGDPGARAIALGAVAAVIAFVCGGLFVTAELTFPFWIAIALIGRGDVTRPSPSGRRAVRARMGNRAARPRRALAGASAAG